MPNDIDKDVDEALIRILGDRAVVGGCPDCLSRLRPSVRDTRLAESIAGGGPTHAASAAPWDVPILTDLLASVALATGGRPHSVGLSAPYIRPFDMLGADLCSTCAELAPDMPATLKLQTAPKPAPEVFRTHALERLRITDVEALGTPRPDLSSLSTAPVHGSFVVRCDAHVSRCFWGGHAQSYGASRRIGLCEALERYAATRPRARRTMVVAPYAEVAADALDPRLCGEYAEGAGYARFSPELPRPWVWGYSLRDERPILVPEHLAYFDAPGATELRFVQESSSGSASGGAPAEAAYHGLMEVVERDAFLIAWYARRALPPIDSRSVTGPGSLALIDRLALYGYRTHLFDTRADLPIPVVAAVAERVDGGLGRLCFGAAASLDPEAAVYGALCEIATDAVNMPRRTLEAAPRLRRIARDFTQLEDLDDHPLLYGLPEMAAHAEFLLGDARDEVGRSLAETFSGAPRATRDLAEDVRLGVAAVAQLGFDTIVVDQTLPAQRERGLTTVKAIVPGLVPIDFGWRRQRAPHMARVLSRTRDSLPNPAPHPYP